MTRPIVHIHTFMCRISIGSTHRQPLLIALCTFDPACTEKFNKILHFYLPINRFDRLAQQRGTLWYSSGGTVVHGYTAQVDTGTVLYKAPTDNMASNAAFNEEEQQPSTMHRPSGSGFGAEENYEEQSNMERRENVRSNRTW